jgi:hypothetical protein
MLPQLREVDRKHLDTAMGVGRRRRLYSGDTWTQIRNVVRRHMDTAEGNNQETPGYNSGMFQGTPGYNSEV